MLRKVLRNNLKGYRRLSKLTQALLAAKSGVDRGVIKRIEGEKEDVSLDTIERLALALDIDALYLLQLKETSVGRAIVSMPRVDISEAGLKEFGNQWKGNKNLSRSPPCSSGELCRLADRAFGRSLQVMLGGIRIEEPRTASLLPPFAECIEIGPVAVVGGIRPQNFDVGYRPDGVRIVFDSKSLNDTKSVQKNWKNMVNDLATEAATVHSRFPHAVVAFMVMIPKPCFIDTQKGAIVQALKRLNNRVNVDDADFIAESIALVVWDPYTGTICKDEAIKEAGIDITDFSDKIYEAYIKRYAGFPPHAELSLLEDTETGDLSAFDEPEAAESEGTEPKQELLALDGS